MYASPRLSVASEKGTESVRGAALALSGRHGLLAEAGTGFALNTDAGGDAAPACAARAACFAAERNPVRRHKSAGTVFLGVQLVPAPRSRDGSGRVGAANAAEPPARAAGGSSETEAADRRAREGVEPGGGGASSAGASGRARKGWREARNSVSCCSRDFAVGGRARLTVASFGETALRGPVQWVWVRHVR